MRKKYLIHICLILCAVVFTSKCLLTEPGILTEVYLYPKDIWGEWIRMDNGIPWYIASNYIVSTDKDPENSYSISKQSDNVIKVIETTDNSTQKVYYLYASRIPTSSFRASVFMDGEALNQMESNNRAIAAPGGMKAKIPNVNNPASSPEAVTDENGILEVDGIIAGDEYDVIIGNDTARIKPNTDGEDIGSITLINGNGLNFKATVQSSTDLMKLFTNQDNNINIIVTNTGSVTARYSGYTISTPDGLTITGDTSGFLGTIDPGRTYTIPLAVHCSRIPDEFEFKKIGIIIKDNTGGNLEWDDSVSLKFNRDDISIKIRAMGKQGSEGNINGIVIVPGGKAYHFSAAGSSGDQPITAVRIPKYAGKDYLIAFSGASIGSESAFSFRIDDDPDTIASNFNPGFDELYFMHDTEDKAKRINGDSQIMSFLGANDVIYFKISFP